MPFPLPLYQRMLTETGLPNGAGFEEIAAAYAAKRMARWKEKDAAVKQQADTDRQ